MCAQRRLTKEYKEPSVKFCGACGSRVSSSAAWAFAKLYGPWYCISDGHLDEGLNPIGE